MNQASSLKAIKTVHTAAWAFFAGCTFALPFATWRGEHRMAVWLATIVFAEVAVLALNHWRCPLTSLAARYTADRRANFDIYLPEWLAKHNITIFGLIYVVGLVFLLAHWLHAAS